MIVWILAGIVAVVFGVVPRVRKHPGEGILLGVLLAWFIVAFAVGWVWNEIVWGP